MMLGCASFFLMALGAAGLFVVSAVMDGRRFHPEAGLYIALSVLLAGSGVWLFVWRYKHGRGLIPGFLLGLGLVGLAAGFCFIAFG